MQLVTKADRNRYALVETLKGVQLYDAPLLAISLCTQQLIAVDILLEEEKYFLTLRRICRLYEGEV